MLRKLLAIPVVMVVIVDQFNPSKTMFPKAQSARLLLGKARTSNLGLCRGRPIVRPNRHPGLTAGPYRCPTPKYLQMKAVITKEGRRAPGVLTHPAVGRPGRLRALASNRTLGSIIIWKKYRHSEALVIQSLVIIWYQSSSPMPVQ